MNLIKIENNKKIDDKELKTVIIFDDFERSTIKKTILLGYINDFCEYNKIKTIIISNEEKIDKSQKDNEDDFTYKIYKEKTIYKTIKMNVDYYEIINQIIDSIKYKDGNYASFVKDKINILYKIFLDSKKTNLRVLKNIVIDFERIYLICTKKIKAVDKYITSIFIIYNIYKYEIAKGQSNINNNIISLPNKENYSLYDDSYNIISIYKWAKFGEWNIEKISKEIKELFLPKSEEPYQILLSSFCWEIEESIFTKGFKQAIDLSYEGKLNGNNMIRLIKLIMLLVNYNEEFPCKIDFDKMLKGWEERENKVIKKLIDEDNILIFIDNELQIKQYNEILYRLYKSISTSTYEKFNRKGKEILIFALNTPSLIKEYDFRGITLPDIDQELLDTFVSSFDNNNNYAKIQFTRMLLDVEFDLKNNKDKIINEYEKIIEKIGKKLDHKNIVDRCAIKQCQNMIKHKISSFNDN